MLRERYSSKGLPCIHPFLKARPGFLLSHMDPVYIQFSTLVIVLANGVTLLVTAQHLRVPAIVPLLLSGILLGPEASGLIDPADFGNGLDLLVAGCVAVILFEGGLSLQRIGFEQAPKVIWRLLTIGVLIT